MATPKTEAEEQAFSRYITEATAKIRASWSEITHRQRASGLQVHEVQELMGWRAPMVGSLNEESFWEHEKE